MDVRLSSVSAVKLIASVNFAVFYLIQFIVLVYFGRYRST